MSAREQMLRAVRAALADVPDEEAAAAPPNGHSVTRSRSTAALVDLFEQRVAGYRATVTRAAASDLAAAVGARASARGARRLVVAPGVPSAWLPDLIEPVTDDSLSPTQLDGLDGALTGCALAIAETGTIALDGGARSGRRAITLVPDLHLCVVEAEQIGADVPEAIARLEAAARDERRPITLVSGPSATSDIELSRVEGVHGPRTLEVIVVTSESP